MGIEPSIIEFSLFHVHVLSRIRLMSWPFSGPANFIHVLADELASSFSWPKEKLPFFPRKRREKGKKGHTGRKWHMSLILQKDFHIRSRNRSHGSWRKERRKIAEHREILRLRTVFGFLYAQVTRGRFMQISRTRFFFSVRGHVVDLRMFDSIRFFFLWS